MRVAHVITRMMIGGAQENTLYNCHDLIVAGGVAPREKFTTIYSGMEVEPFLNANDHRAAMREQLGYADDHVVIGKIARLFHLKGHDDLIAAAKGVVERAPQSRFLLI